MTLEKKYLRSNPILFAKSFDKTPSFKTMILILLAIIPFIFPTYSNAQNTDSGENVQGIKKEILLLARSYAGQGDPDKSKQKSLEVLVDKLLKANPQPSIKDRLVYLYGAWKQEWGPYDYKQNKRGVDPELGVNEIYQVVFPGDYYYNVAPSYKKGDLSREKIGLLKGEYTFDKTQQNTLLVKFKSLSSIDKRPSDGTPLYDLPALIESKKLSNVKSVLPGFLVRLLFGGGALKEIYTDQDMRILYGAGSNKFKNKYIYIMSRVGNVSLK